MLENAQRPKLWAPSQGVNWMAQIEEMVSDVHVQESSLKPISDIQQYNKGGTFAYDSLKDVWLSNELSE